MLLSNTICKPPNIQQTRGSCGSFPTPEVRGSNPVIGGTLFKRCDFCEVLPVEKTKIKRKRGRGSRLKKLTNKFNKLVLFYLGINYEFANHVSAFIL